MEGAPRGTPPTSRRDPTAASTRIAEADLHSPGASSADVLFRVPGVQPTRTGAVSDLATASIRGATSAQTPVYLAGIRLNDDVTGTADLSTVPLWMLDRVEVFRGNAPEDANQLGIGGAIMFEPKLTSKDRIGAGVGIGSFGFLSTWAAATATSRSTTALLAVRRERADNDYYFLDDRGTRFESNDDRKVRRLNADFESYDAWSIGRADLGGGARLLWLTNAFVREQGVTGLSVIPASAARARVQRTLTALSARIPCGGNAPSEETRPCTLELSSTLSLSKSTIRDPLRELSLLTTELTSEGEHLAQQVRLHRAWSDNLSLGAGVLQSLDHLQIIRVGGAPITARRASTRLSATAAGKAHDRLFLHALAALECHATWTARHEGICGSLPLVGRVGLKLGAVQGIDLLANVGRYVRLPSLGELYGISPFVLGNSELRNEQGFTGDLGVRIAAPELPCRDCSAYLDMFAFARMATDLVAFRRSSFGVVRPFNVGQARVAGVELATGFRALNALRIEFTMSATDPRDVTAGRHLINDILPFQSRLVLSPFVELYAEPAPWGLPVERASVAARFSYRSPRYADPAGQLSIDGQALVDLELSLHLFKRRVAVRSALRNVLDGRQFDVIGLPLPGRSVHLDVEAWWP